ncbi:MAG: hypothetical protein DRJ52_09445 [Thermoprotei archaeon]|nr:MAG: hypothetical protein DRJ52_09445 [Thermoprotei archaeon]
MVDPLIVLLILYSGACLVSVVTTFNDIIKAKGTITFTDLALFVREVMEILFAFIWYYAILTWFTSARIPKATETNIGLCIGGLEVEGSVLFPVVALLLVALGVYFFKKERRTLLLALALGLSYFILSSFIGPEVGVVALSALATLVLWLYSQGLINHALLVTIAGALFFYDITLGLLQEILFLMQVGILIAVAGYIIYISELKTPP